MAKTQNKKEPSFFVKMFMDSNDINEKSIVGFGSFIMMMITLGVDVATGFMGTEMPINEFVFDGFLYLTVASFGIASVDKYFTGKKNQAADDEASEEITE